MSEIVELTEEIARYTESIACPCGGFADKVDATPEEDKKYGCLYRFCCSVAFLCRVCGNRLVGRYEAPEAD